MGGRAENPNSTSTHRAALPPLIHSCKIEQPVFCDEALKPFIDEVLCRKPELKLRVALQYSGLKCGEGAGESFGSIRIQVAVHVRGDHRPAVALSDKRIHERERIFHGSRSVVHPRHQVAVEVPAELNACQRHDLLPPPPRPHGQRCWYWAS